MLYRSRFLLATVLSAILLGAGCLSSAQALPLNIAGGALPSGFVQGLEYQDLEKFYSSTGVDAPRRTSELDLMALPSDTFEKAASRGLASLSVTEKTPSLEDFLALASIGTGLYATSTEGGDANPAFGTAGPDTLYGPGITVRNLAQVLVNRAEAPLRNPAAQRTARHENGFSLFNVLMDTQLDTEFVEAATEVVTPTVTSGGVIALNFLGLRDFAFVVSPVSNQIQVMDFTSGTTLTLSNGDHDNPSPDRFAQQQSGQQTQVTTARPRISTQMLLAQIKKVLAGYLLHPFTLGSLALFSIFWIVLRIARRAS